ncbi:hypothetical protein LIER_05395 [Lithospermum erythrorhizon]|uniref:Uncharacterized protein n=1 Tax=Lithospermum erythrorhizon TaxID=34254 RepID=A0AAV3P0K6_LITER
MYFWLYDVRFLGLGIDEDIHLPRVCSSVCSEYSRLWAYVDLLLELKSCCAEISLVLFVVVQSQEQGTLSIAQMMENEMKLNISAPILSIRKYLSPRATAYETAGIVSQKSPIGGHLSLLVDRSKWEPEEVTKPAAVPFLWERAPGRPKGDCSYHSNEEPGITPRPSPGRLFKECTLRPPPGQKHNAQNLKGEACPSPRPPLGRFFEKCTLRPPPGGIHNSLNLKGEASPSPRPPLGRLFEVCTFKPPPGGIHNAQNLKGEACSSPRPPPRRLFEVYNYRPPSERIHSAQTLSFEACPSSRPRLPGKIFGEMCSPRIHPRLVDSAGGVRTSRLTSRKLTDIRDISVGKSIEQNNTSCQVEAFTTTDPASLPQSLKECLDADWESDKDSWDDPFYDALDTLSPNESLSLKSSAGGLSSSYHQNHRSSGNFSVDPQTRASMMSRFLPASKSAEVHEPHHVIKKSTVVIGEHKTLQDFIDFERKPLLMLPGLNARPSSNQHLGYLNHEDVEYDDPEFRIGKTCGVFQGLCVNNFVTYLNPKSGMKLKPQSSKASSDEVKKVTKNGNGRPVDKRVYDETCKKQYPSEDTSQELHKIRNTLTCKPKRIALSTNSYKMADRISSTIPRSGGTYHVHNERPPSLIREEDLFLGVPKPVEPKTDEISPLLKRDHHVNKVSAQCSNRQGFEPQVVAIAKTMYEDTLQKKVRYMKLNSSESQLPSNSLTRNLATMARSDAVCDFGSTGMVSTSTHKSGLPGLSPIKEKCNQEHYFLGTEELKVGENLVNGQEESNRAVLLHPLSLPLPQSPSESWLWRTRPSTNLQNSFARSHGDRRLRNVSKNKQPSKWEKLVKSSKIHHDNFHYQRLLNNVDRYSKISDA